MIGKLDFQTCNYFNRLLITIDFATRHSQFYFYLFIHIIYMQCCNNDQVKICMYNVHIQFC